MAQVYGMDANITEVKEFVLNIHTLNMASAKKGQERWVSCIWGQKGIGKTYAVKQLAGTEHVDRVIDIPIAQIEEMGDFHGLPMHQEIDGKMVTVTAPPHWVPTDPDEKVIILIDDFNRADQRIIKGIMQLIQDHKTISWRLPNNVSLVLTANPPEEDYLVAQLDPAILTRMMHIQMGVDFKSWLLWAEQNDIDSRVKSFIARYQEMLAPIGSERTCPRSYHMLSTTIKNLPMNTTTSNIALLKRYAAATLDIDSVTSFISFLSGDFEMIIEPKLIAEEYSKTETYSNKLKKIVADGRIDVINATLERLTAYINSLSSIKKGSNVQQNIIKLLEEDFINADMKHLYVNLLAKGNMSNVILSAKLAKQLQVVLS